MKKVFGGHRAPSLFGEGSRKRNVASRAGFRIRLRLACLRLLVRFFWTILSHHCADYDKMTDEHPMQHCVIWPARCLGIVFSQYIASLQRPVEVNDYLQFGAEDKIKEYYDQNHKIVRHLTGHYAFKFCWTSLPISRDSDTFYLPRYLNLMTDPWPSCQPPAC